MLKKLLPSWGFFLPYFFPSAKRYDPRTAFLLAVSITLLGDSDFLLLFLGSGVCLFFFRFHVFMFFFFLGSSGEAEVKGAVS